MMNKRKLSFTSTGIALSLSLALLLQQTLSMAGPIDSVGFGDASSMATAGTPKTAAIGSSGTVASSTGAFSYSYAITVPPGRLAMQPNLSLNYSSQGALYGGVASQWTLGIPEIRVDYSDGRLNATSTELPWTSSLSGGHRLVLVNEPSSSGSVPYRAEQDDGYIRYEKFGDLGTGNPNPLWIARTPDGMVRSFGIAAHILDGGDNPVALEDRAPLTQEVDKFGNTVDYYWRVTDENGYLIERIEYTKNRNVAGAKHFAEVSFNYGLPNTCRDDQSIGVGGKSDNRGPVTRIEGDWPLNTIFMKVYDDPTDTIPREVRRIELIYTQPCTVNRSRTRLLVGITEIGTDRSSIEESRNPITFSYGPTERDFDTVTTFDPSGPPNQGTEFKERLSWGRRHATLPLANNVESMLIDLDGDGRLDRIFSDWDRGYAPPQGSGESRNASAGVNGNLMDGCGFVWLRNDGTKFSQSPINPNAGESVPVKFPRINWRHSAAEPGPGESCSLTGQVTAVRNTEPNELCGNESSTRLVYNFMDVDADGLPDLVAALYYDDYFYDPQFDDTWPPTPITAYTTDGSIIEVQGNGQDLPTVCIAQFEHEKTVGGKYWLYWWKNKGPDLGFFDIADPRFIDSPIPLNANVGSSHPLLPHGGVRVSYGYSAFQDIDGDGYVDAIWSDGFENTRVISTNGVDAADVGPRTTLWSVHLGDGQGGFHPPPSGPAPAYPWPVPKGAEISTEVRGLGASQGINHSLTELVDVNADGLVDLVYWYLDPPNVLTATPSLGSSRIYLNNGQGFDFFDSIDGGPPFAPPLFDDPSRPHSTLNMSPYVGTQPGEPGFGVFTDANGEARIRFADFDSDGRPDLFAAQALQIVGLDPQPFTAPLDFVSKVYINPGYQTLITPGEDTIIGADDMDLVVELTGTDWAVTTDFIDLDGDGEPEKVSAVAPDQLLLLSRDTGDEPLRLLNRIDNGSGLITDIAYAPHNDPAVAVSGQSNYTVMPSHQWVVKSVTRTDAASGPLDAQGVPFGTIGVSEVRYGDPVWNENPLRGKFGFRGFSRIETSGVRGLGESSGFPVTEQKYDYTVDWSGRLSETVLHVDGFPQEGAVSEVASVSRQTWGAFPLTFGGVTTTSYKVSKSESWNCLGSIPGTFSTYSTCTARAATLTQDTTWTPSASVLQGGGTSPLLYCAEDATTHGPLGADEDGTKRQDRVCNILSDNSHYWMTIAQVDSSVREGAGFVTVASTAQVVDTTNRYYEFVHRLVEVGTVTTEETTRDSNTGLVQFFRNPNNQGTPGPMAYVYDAFEMYPTSITNYLGHVDTLLTDIGTGAALEVYGPNALPCDAEKKHGIKTQYDGLGRPVEVREVGCSGAGGIFDDPVLSTISYVEFASALAPAQVTTTLNIDTSTPPQTLVSTTYVDGSGRIIRTEIEDGNPGDPIRAISEFNEKGQLIRSIGPNPSTESQAPATVAAVYTYDSLGRVIKTRDETSNTGVDHEYSFDGKHTITATIEVVNDGQPAGKTTVYSDVFGRMVQVDEFTNTGIAATVYEYDGNDNVRRIVDADGIETDMEHDQLSRRTKVTRGEREWTYAYDLNGNLIVETAPNAVGETADAPGIFSTSTIYDALDRVDARFLAERTLSQEQLDDYDAREVDYTYDCIGDLGRLCKETAGSNLAKTYVYDYAGYVVEETQEVALPTNVVNVGAGGGFAPPARTTYRKYNLAGAMTDVWLPDGPDKASSTHVSYTFDNFTGAPETMVYAGPGGVGFTTEVQRNKSQRVTQQVIGCLSRSWDYDHMGRVTNTTVTAIDCPGGLTGVLARESMTYFDSSEIATQAVSRAGSPQRTFTYGYDKQHQLVSAVDDLGDYGVAFDYSQAGRLDEVKAPLTGILAGREPFVYSYGDGLLAGADRHAPVSLAGIGRNADYLYDHAGNVTKRVETHQGASTIEWDFAYDGTDQQREVLLQNGSGGRELYYYDGSGQRYMSVTYDSWGPANPPANPVPSRIRVWNGDAEIWYEPNATTGAMEVQTEYAHLGLGALPIGRVKTTDRTDPLNPTSTAEASFHNGLGHLMGAADMETGVANAGFVYGPYGEVVDSIGAEEEDHLRRFNNKEADQISNLSYYGYRYYDELSMAWTQADPLYLAVPDLAGANPREMTLYAFSLNNPLRYMDPNGLASRSPSSQVQPSGGTTVDVSCTDGSNDCFKTEEEKNAAFVADAEAEFRRWEEGFTIGGLSTAKRHRLDGSHLLFQNGATKQYSPPTCSWCGRAISILFGTHHKPIFDADTGEELVLYQAGMPNWRALLVKLGIRAAPVTGVAATGVPFLHKNSGTVAVAFRGGLVRVANTPYKSHLEYAKEVGALINGKLIEGAVPITIIKDRLGQIHVLGSSNFTGVIRIPDWAIKAGKSAVR